MSSNNKSATHDKWWSKGVFWVSIGVKLVLIKWDLSNMSKTMLMSSRNTQIQMYTQMYTQARPVWTSSAEFSLTVAPCQTTWGAWGWQCYVRLTMIWGCCWCFYVFFQEKDCGTCPDGGETVWHLQVDAFPNKQNHHQGKDGGKRIWSPVKISCCFPSNEFCNTYACRQLLVSHGCVSKILTRFPLSI